MLGIPIGTSVSLENDLVHVESSDNKVFWGQTKGSTTGTGTNENEKNIVFANISNLEIPSSPMIPAQVQLKRDRVPLVTKWFTGVFKIKLSIGGCLI